MIFTPRTAAARGGLVCDGAEGKKLNLFGRTRPGWSLVLPPLTLKISLNICCPAAIYYRVRRFRNLLFALAAFLWLPVSAHCRLETLTGLDFLACETDSSCHGDPKTSADNAGCCSVEKSQYQQAAQIRVNLPSPHLLPVLFTALILAATNALTPEVCGDILIAAPPELLPSRHFLFRTALPVRAPSLAS